MPAGRAPPPASVNALARAKAKAASETSNDRKRNGNPFVRKAIPDGDDDPDRLYFSRGLGALDSDSDSGDSDSIGVGEGNDWGEDEVFFTDDWDPNADEQRDRPAPVLSSYQPPLVSYNLNPPGYVSPNHSGSDTEEEGSKEVDARFEWQHMLSNVLDGDVLKSEKTRLSTASLSTTTLARGFEYVGEGKTGKRQRAYAIWLLVRAKVRGTSPEEESRYIVEARAKVDDVLQEVLKFRVQDLVRKEGEPPIGADARAKHAEDQVGGLLQRVDWCETLYPSTNALALEKEKMRDLELVTRLEALRSWQAITRRLAVSIGILKKWTGEDWETLSTIHKKEPASEVVVEVTKPEGEENGSGSPEIKATPKAPETLAFVAGIVREDTLQITFEKRLLSDLYSLVNVAKSAMTDLGPEFESMNLPGFSSDLLRLALFPSRLVQEVLRTRIESLANIHDPSVTLIDQFTDTLRKTLWTACEIKKQYIDIAETDPVAGWQLPARVEEYDETLLAALRYFFKLLHWKLKSPSRAIYFKETEIVENEWGFLSGVTEQIDGGDLLVGEHFSTLTHRLLLRVLGYFETQLQVLETRDMNLHDMLRWFSQTLDNVRARHRKLLRFGKTMLQRFENSAEYKLEDIDLATFLNGLVETRHFIIYTGTFEREGIYVIGDPSLHERPDLVRHILARCFSRNTQYDSPSRTSEPPRPGPPEARAAEYYDGEDHRMHYVLLLSPREPFIWSGRVMNLELPKMEFDLRDRRVRLISDGPGIRLARSKQMFLDLFPAFRRNVLIEQKAHLARVSREIKKIGRAVFRLAVTILTSVDRIKAVSLRTPGQGQDLVGSYFSFAADLGQRSIKYLEPSVRTRYVLMLMKFSISWIAFICDDCVPTDPRTFKWAVPALEFAMFITRGDNILKFSGDEFALLRSKVASCMTLLISHFDILGARSSHEAKKEQDRIDAARLETKRKLALKLRQLKVPGHYDDILTEVDTAVDGEGSQAGGSLKLAWKRRMEALQAIEDHRTGIERANRTVGKVMDQDTAGDRGLAFLASSSSNISIRWQQGKFIGGGTFGQVYLAVNLDSGEELAVKEIRFQDLTSAPHLIKTIRDEMGVMEMLRHPNIVEYYGIEVHRDKVYIFEEYCAGGSLANLLEHGRIEDEILIQIYAAQMLDGLEYLHGENVVHRDIKPDNILLDGNGTIKYVDFGAAKVLAKNSKTLAGRSRIAVDGGADANSLTGTPMYLSPETVKGERRGRKGAMDVWSLGCVILECATGRRPWSNLDNEWAIMFHIGIAVQHPPLPDPSQLSELGIDFIRQCLMIDPDKRPTAVELLSHPWIEQARQELAGAWEEESQAGLSSIGSTNGSWGTVTGSSTEMSSLGSNAGLAPPLVLEEEDEEEFEEDDQNRLDELDEEES
ncbi:mitogen-activated protein kinase kinase kinase, partial [Phenoliferia sp. Uapishka_3]